MMLSNSGMDPKLFYKEYIAPYKADLELWYKKNQSLYTYFRIIGLTAWTVVFSDSKLYEKVFKDLPEPPKELIV